MLKYTIKSSKYIFLINLIYYEKENYFSVFIIIIYCNVWFLISYNSDNQNNNFNPTYTAINKSNISIKNNLIELSLFNSQNALTLSQTKVSDLNISLLQTFLNEWNIINYILNNPSANTKVTIDDIVSMNESNGTIVIMVLINNDETNYVTNEIFTNLTITGFSHVPKITSGIEMWQIYTTIFIIVIIALIILMLIFLIVRVRKNMISSIDDDYDNELFNQK